MNAPILNSAVSRSCQNFSLFASLARSAALLLGLCLTLPAWSALSVDQVNGTVTDSTTGLMWDRCTYGLTGTACATGNAVAGNWATALTTVASAKINNYKGHSDWRLPNKNELESLVMINSFNPAIDSAAFPATPSGYFWASSNYSRNSGFAWYVDFSDGNTTSQTKTLPLLFRLVRSGQSLASFDLLGGPASFALTVNTSGNGTVTSSAAGINCGATCNAFFASGTSVTLTATPVSGSTFTGWSGDCTGAAATCTVTMDVAKTVSASFQDTPLISGLPASLSYLPRNVGSTSPAQTVTLTNSGTAALAISSITASGDYAVTHNCGSGLGVNSFCTMNVSFTPSAVGTRTGSVIIASNVPGSPYAIALSGTGQGATAVISSNTLAYASQGTGIPSAAQTLTLSNTGGAVLNIASMATTGDFSRTTTCASTLAAGSNCSVSIVFTPTAAGARSGSLTISHDALVGNPITVSLSGTGVAVPAVALNPTSLTFTSQALVTSSTTQTVNLQNNGAAALTLTSITASGDFAQSNNCGGGLGIGGSCSINVTFTPTVAGARTGTLSIASNATGSPHSVSLSGVGTAPTRLINLSTRGQVQTGDNVMIGGLIIGGSTPKKVLIRAVGPNLANFGVSGVLADPVLQLYSGSTVIASNDDWQTQTTSGDVAAITASTLAPVDAKEAAILTTLSPGAYTAIVSGKSNTSGVGIVEVYELDHPEIPLINISTRGQVLTGDNVMIGGFIIQGMASQTVLIRAVGPNLANFGVTGVLANPTLTLYSGQTVIASNDDWQTSSNANYVPNVAAIQASTLAPVSPLEAAILLTLPPGAYTAIVSGSGGGTGVGIIEVFAQ